MGHSINSTPVAIVAGAGLIAVAVFFGLRSRPVVVAPPSSTGGSAPAAGLDAPAGSSSPVLSAPPPPTNTGTTRAAATLQGMAPPSAVNVDADVLAALEKQRPILLTSCWKGAKGSTASYIVDASFDEQGRQVARGLTGEAGAPGDLMQCLSLRSPPLSIPAKGVRSHARVSFSLP
jgi:hypothetical protein